MPAGAASSAGTLTFTKLQVGLLSSARELKHKLDNIATYADTSSSEGLQLLLQGEACEHASLYSKQAHTTCCCKQQQQQQQQQYCPLLG
jgi:uncharacterized membrane protein